MEWPNHRAAGDVDNQLGHIHNNLRSLIPKGIGFDITLYQDGYPNAYIVKDVVPRELAERARRFLTEIPFDSTCPELNDTDNPPKRVVYKEAMQLDKIFKAYETKRYAPGEWTWEKYHSEFWRAAPLTSEAYWGSPVIELIDCLEERWRATDTSKLWGLMPVTLTGPTGPVELEINPFGFRHMRKMTWVIQQVAKGYGMGWHNDDFTGRKAAFIYYLTSDDWNYKEDGGALGVCRNNDKEDYVYINPEFNTMVWWDMLKQKSPLHGVGPVKSDGKTRFALVGFWG
jgi:hypothetical protein